MATKTLYPLAEAALVAGELVEQLRPFCNRIAIAGSIRRCKVEVGDIELVYIPKLTPFGDSLVYELSTLMEKGIFTYRPDSRGRITYGPKNKYLRHIPSGISVDVFSTTEENWGMALVVRTGPKEFNVKIMSRFRRLGMQGHAYGGVEVEPGLEVFCPDEESVFKLAQCSYIPPEQRK